MKMEPIVSSETSAIKSQTPGNYPKRNKLRSVLSSNLSFILTSLHCLLLSSLTFPCLFDSNTLYILLLSFFSVFNPLSESFHTQNLMKHLMSQTRVSYLYIYKEYAYDIPLTDIRYYNTQTTISYLTFVQPRD